MSQDVWTAADRYIESKLGTRDESLDEALLRIAEARMPAISVSANLGRFLQLMARAIASRCILEVGTLGGYSTIWLARALAPGGRVVTLEIDSHHAEVAAANLERAGVLDRVEIVVGPAERSMVAMMESKVEPFDFVFIDADKELASRYFELALAMTRKGGLIVTDNVVREGAVADATSTDPRVVGVRRFFDRVGSEPTVMGAALQTVGVKGYDGIAVALVQ